MKNFFLFISILSLGVLCSYAQEDTVFLDLNAPEIHKYDTGKIQFDNQKPDITDDDENYLKPSFHTMKKMFDEDFYSEKKVSNKKEKKLGEKTTLGAKYDTKIKSDSATQDRTLYARQNLTERMSVEGAYKTNSQNGIDGATKGTVSVAPEYKFNKKTSVKNVYSRNMGKQSNSGEVQIQYKPFKDDRMDMNVGAGQTMYDDGGQTSSRVNAGATFRF